MRTLLIVLLVLASCLAILAVVFAVATLFIRKLRIKAIAALMSKVP